MSEASVLIEREITLISRFVDALRKEQDVLKEGRADDLLPIVEEKSVLAEQLNVLEGERHALLGLGHAAYDAKAMSDWLATANDPLAAVNWKKLLELAREAKALHQINGRLIDMHLQNTTGSIAVLTQKSVPPPLYGADGQTANHTGSRIVDSA